ILIFSSTDNPSLLDRQRGFIDYLKRFPGIKFVQKPIYIPFKDVGPPLQAQARAIFQRYPKGTLDYVYTPFDGFTVFVVNAAQDLGRTDLKMLGFDGVGQNLDLIRKGTSQVADIAIAFNWCGWTAIDGLNRALAGVKFKETPCPTRVFDK